MAGADRAPTIRPRPTVAGRLDDLARASVPAVATLGLMLAASLPWGVPMQAAALPAVAVGSVWFWSLHRPAALPPALAFALGAVLDLLGFLPLGTGVLMLLTVHAIAIRAGATLRGRRLRVVWPVFAAVAVAASLGGWAVASALQWRLLPLAPACLEAALTVAVYPGLAAVLARAPGAPTAGPAPG